jgi:hypothetical protein
MVECWLIGSIRRKTQKAPPLFEPSTFGQALEFILFKAEN